jgi:FdhD protein
MDKLVGSAIIKGNIPIADEFVVVSGRASFELVQKSLRAGFPMMVSIGAPSTLAIDMANEYGMTLACFAKKDSITVYSGLRRFSP